MQMLNITNVKNRRMFTAFYEQGKYFRCIAMERENSDLRFLLQSNDKKNILIK